MPRPSILHPLFSILVCLSISASAQPLADRLPATTMVYLGWSPSASMQSTAAAKMLTDERILGPWRRIFQEELLDLHDGAEGGRISEHLPALLTDAAQCEGCFALLELKQDKKHFNPQSVLMLDLGAKRKKFEEHFKPIQARMKERLGDRLQMMKVQGSWVYFKPDREGKPRVTWGFIGDMFVVFFGDGAEDFVPKLVKGKFENPLKTAPAFVDCVDKIPGESVFTTFLDTKVALTIGRHLLDREAGPDLRTLLGQWDKVLDEVGVGNVKGIAEKTSIEDKQFVTRSLLRTDGPPKGLLALAGAAAVDDAVLKTIPLDAMAATAFRLDLAKTYDQVKGSAIAIAGNDAKQGFDQLEQGAEGLGLPIKDVLGPLGDQWVIYNAQSHGGFALTGWTLIGTIREPDKFGRSLKTVRNLVIKGVGGDGDRPKIHTMEVDGVTIEYLQAARWDWPFPSAWAVVGDKFIVALYPQLVEDAVRQIQKPEKTILDNPNFVAARKRSGGAGPLVYLSGPEVVNNLYPIGLVLLQFLNGMGGGFRDLEDGTRDSMAELLPSMRRLIDYVGYDAVGVKATPNGLLKTRTVANPLLSPLAWVDSPVIWIALGIPGMSGAEDAADRTKSATNLRQIGQGILLYSNENKGNYPPDLATLVKAQTLTDEIVKSPFGPAKDGNDIVYLHFAGMSNKNATAEVIIAYDAAALEQGEGTNVLYGDGHVDWMDTSVFRKALEESKKKAQLNNAAP